MRTARTRPRGYHDPNGTNVDTLRPTISDSRGDSWPVLAQLPDVSDRPERDSRTTRTAAAGFVNYRFDPAETAGPRAARDTNQACEAVAKSASEIDPIRAAIALARRQSSILPDSNPFEIPDRRTHEAWGPLARFLLLVALVSCAGTALLMYRNAPIETETPPAPVVHRTTDRTVASAAGSHTAAGPASNWKPTAADASIAHRNERDESIAVSSDDLPKVRTSDQAGTASTASGVPQPAVARLSGTIQEVPTRQAHHDRHEPSLH